MSTLSHLMREYFDSPVNPVNTQNNFGLLTENLNGQQLPVVPDKSEWRVVTDPERFIRRFEFDSRDRLKDFLMDLMNLEDSLGHHGKLSIDNLSVDVEVYTHTVDCITELDQEYTSVVNKLYEDVLHYGYDTTI